MQQRPSTLNAAAQAGVDQGWFHRLTPGQRLDCLRHVIEHPQVAKRAETKDFEPWSVIVYACFDAELNCDTPGAIELARQWSVDGSNKSKAAGGEELYDPLNFDHRLDDFKVGRIRVNIGSILKKEFVEANNLDLTPWLAAANATVGNSTTVVNGALSYDPTEPIPTPLPIAEGMRIMNARYAHVQHWGSEDGQALVAEQKADGSWIAYKADELKAKLPNRIVTWDDRDDKPRQASLVTAWLKHAGLREFRNALFDPTGTRIGPNDLNLWSGLAVEPQKRPWNLMANHVLHVICDYDKSHPPAKRAEAIKLWRFWVRWHAFAVQCPGVSPITALTYFSRARGTGKSLAAFWLAELFGRHGIILKKKEHLTGRFTGRLEGKCAVILDDARFARGRDEGDAVRSLLTTPTTNIERKGLDDYDVPNVLHIVQTTNDPDAVPVEENERRFAIFEVSDRYKAYAPKNKPYFNALRAQAENGGLKGMLRGLLRVRVTADDICEAPITAALQQSKILGAPSEVQWALGAIAAGDFGVIAPGVTVGFGERHSLRVLDACYTDWCRQHRKPKITDTALSQFLSGKCGCARSRPGGRTHITIPDVRTFAKAVSRGAGWT